MKTERLPVRLTEAETLQKAKIVADLHAEIGEKEQAEKLRRDAAKDAIELLRARLGELAGQIRRGEEYREVEVTESLDYRRKVREIVRTDTGEIVRTVAMTATELQAPIPFEPRVVEGEVEAAEGERA
jgi:hypothetical protein